VIKLLSSAPKTYLFVRRDDGVCVGLPTTPFIAT